MMLARSWRSRRQRPIKGTQRNTRQKWSRSSCILLSAGIEKRKVHQVLIAGVRATSGGAKGAAQGPAWCAWGRELPLGLHWFLLLSAFSWENGNWREDTWPKVFLCPLMGLKETWVPRLDLLLPLFLMCPGMGHAHAFYIILSLSYGRWNSRI